MGFERVIEAGGAGLESCPGWGQAIRDGGLQGGESVGGEGTTGGPSQVAEVLHL